jgi:hypothetical protein
VNRVTFTPLPPDLHPPESYIGTATRQKWAWFGVHPSLPDSVWQAARNQRFLATLKTRACPSQTSSQGAVRRMAPPARATQISKYTTPLTRSDGLRANWSTHEGNLATVGVGPPDPKRVETSAVTPRKMSFRDPITDDSDLVGIRTTTDFISHLLWLRNTILRRQNDLVSVRRPRT